MDVSRDAIQDEKRGLIYNARIRLDCTHTGMLHPNKAARNSPMLCKNVGPGMSVQAEIRTGSRRIIQYLLSPISKAVDEAGRER